MIVSVCVVAYNEEKVLGKLLEDIQAQDYDHGKMEVVLIDSMSTDSTKEIMDRFQQQMTDFKNVQVLKNPGKKQASGWNVAIKNFSGDVMIRVDAHASIPPEFVRKNVEILESGEMVSGGPRPNMIDESTPWKETLLLAEQSMFGSSMASYRRSQKKQYVKSLFHGAYRREVLEKVGGFDEQLGRTEDNEFHYRIRKAGYQICYSPEIISYQHARSTLSGMLKQKYHKGDKVLLNGSESNVGSSIQSVKRDTELVVLLGLLIFALMTIAGKKGVLTIITVGINIVIFSVGFLKSGDDADVVAICNKMVIFFAIATLIGLNGIHRKTWAALLSTICVLAMIMGIFEVVISHTAELDYSTMEYLGSIDNPDEDIFLGVDAKVKIYAASAKNVVTLPVEVVNIGKEGSFCYVIEDGLVTKRNITTGISSEDYVEITDGIKEGEEVIADLGDYTEGMEVQAVPEQTGEDADE